MKVKLTEEQKNVIREILKFKKEVQTLGGAAGTGKTTLIQHLIHLLPNWAVCAFTGKAADVLRRKGVPASTIHSLIYTPMTGPNGESIRDQYGNLIFSLAESIPYNGIIVDEASMVSKSLYDDLLSFGLPVIFVGDHFQLEPIGSDVHIMKSPDFRLEKIHRNAGEIAYFAEWIRRGYNPMSFANHFSVKKIKFINRWQADRYLLHVNQIICAFNKTRIEINAKVRYAKQFPEGDPIAGDRVMCLRNNRQLGLFNGMQGTIQYLYHRENRMQFKTEDHLFDLAYDGSQFGKEKYDLEDYNKDDPNPFDWCYCITCHRAQGDEWDNVMVFEQKCNRWDHRRWAYTAASRAKSSMIWVAY